MSEPGQYKDTIQLPSTEFPMKGDLPRREPEILARWNQMGLYKKLIARNQGKPTFAMPDGPPYANGNLHMGHALNKILKDIVVKYRNMAGYQAVFVPGWDCHGLPIEQAVNKNVGGQKLKEKSDAEVRELCRQEARKWIEVQKSQFIRYGVLADWENPYATLDPKYEADEIRTLSKILKTGAFYRGEKPVYWNTLLQTALAEAEVEYQMHKSPSIYVKFELEKGLDKIAAKVSQKLGKVYFVIWTTTPWTLPANVGLAVHPGFEYGLYQSGADTLLLAKGLKESFETTTGVKVTDLGVSIPGTELERMEVKHPFLPRTSLVVLGEHVTLEAGTGVVHTAPGHGQDDYVVGLKYGLPVLSPVDGRGNYTDEFPEMKGEFVFKANPLIIEKLRASGHLLYATEFEHSYPHCWRTKVPLIFRATPQWFLGMDLGLEHSIRNKALRAIKKVKWIPTWGENRITGMIANRPDWCLSRQRIWGVPIPVMYCTKCEKDLASSTVMDRVADAMEAEGGIEAYHKYPANHFTEGLKCEKCGNDQFTKSKDILDVWFDSGCCFSAVQEKRAGLTNPADLYLEGSDQHRGWFHTSLLASIAATGEPPYKTVLTHGFVMYAKGQKMSKSLGNTVDPQEIIKKDGAELLRLWAAHEDYAQDLTCSPESFARLAETYRRLRNTLRFLLGNLSDFDVQNDSIPFEKMLELDRWILGRLNELTRSVTQGYENYEFYRIYHLLNNFATVELSAVYLDILKDRLYTWRKDGLGRRSAQTALHQILETMLGLMAPILTFLAEEGYAFSKLNKKAESIFLTDFPRANAKWDQAQLAEEYLELLKVRSEVQKKLEELRQNKVIRSSLEAEVTLQAEGPRYKVLKDREKDLNSFLIVSGTKLVQGLNQIDARLAQGQKCARCWCIDEKTGYDSRFPGVCPKCVEALR